MGSVAETLQAYAEWIALHIYASSKSQANGEGMLPTKIICFHNINFHSSTTSRFGKSLGYRIPQVFLGFKFGSPGSEPSYLFWSQTSAPQQGQSRSETGEGQSVRAD